MKILIKSLLFLSLVNTAFAETKKISCSYKWKNTNASENSFSFQVEGFGTTKAQVLVSANEDGDMLKAISGIKPSDHEADIALIEVGIDYTAEIFTSAKEDIVIQMSDGTSTEALIKVYKNSNYKSGFITIKCDPSYCGAFEFYSNLKCK